MDTSVCSALASMRLDDPALAEAASQAWEYLDGTDEAERVTQWRVQSFCWYMLPRDRFVASPAQVAAALADLLARVGLSRYADIARSETTGEILAAAESGDRWPALAERAMTASGILPPDTSMISWAYYSGPAESVAYVAVADALELAVQVGEYTPGRSGWRGRRAEITDRVLVAEHAQIGGVVPYDQIVRERIEAWTDVPGSPLRTRLLGPVGRQLAEPVPVPEPATVERLLGRVTGLLAIIGTGVPLTQAGYLRPDVVARCVDELALDAMGDSRREGDQPTLLLLRETVQRLGLIRRRSGRLVLSAAGRAALHDVARLWSEVAARLVPEPGVRGSGQTQASVAVWDLVLAGLVAAPSADRGETIEHCRVVLDESGWRLAGGGPIDLMTTADLYYEVYRAISSLGLLRPWSSDRPPGVDEPVPGAADLIRAALRHRLLHSRTLVRVPR
ncbi:MAG: hypothetical protein GEV10_01885 [Streptosporangiales bacterium]|nr:hypothetical protein [Streptosporangiales bacterium]